MESEFRKSGTGFLDTVKQDILLDWIDRLNDAYYNAEPLLTDAEFDIVQEYVKQKYSVRPKIGAPPVGGGKTTLPFPMPSMNKVKDAETLATWRSTYPGDCHLSAKLDGISALLYCGQLFTRGDGAVGQNITNVLPHITCINYMGNMAIRGELIVPKRVFAAKYAAKFANARNFVSGIILRKTVDPAILSDIHFVAYEIVEPQMCPTEQFRRMAEFGFETAKNEVALGRNEVALGRNEVALGRNEVYDGGVDTVALSDRLVDWRSTYEYQIDGIIVSHNAIYPRALKNPDHAFAFKMVLTDQMAEAVVVAVHWSASKDGYMKPRVELEPVHLNGVVIQYTTGFNAKFIVDNGIGVGAVISLVRSGDVIPHIHAVVQKTTAYLPENTVWTETGVDLVLANAGESAEVRQKQMTQFFATIGVEGLSAGNVRRIYEAGYTTIGGILAMTLADFRKVDGFKDRMSQKIFDGIRAAIAAADIVCLMAAFGMGRGLGEKRLRSIIDTYPNILLDDGRKAKLREIPGIGEVVAADFDANVPAFLAFLRESNLSDKLLRREATGSAKGSSEATAVAPRSGRKIVMTKTRDPAVIAKIQRDGDELQDSITKDTYCLIVKSKDDVSAKMAAAQKRGIPIMTPEEYLSK
jgi:NAD-dependent DNA ligase